MMDCITLPTIVVNLVLQFSPLLVSLSWTEAMDRIGIIGYDVVLCDKIDSSGERCLLPKEPYVVAFTNQLSVDIPRSSIGVARYIGVRAVNVDKCTTEYVSWKKAQPEP